MLFSRFFIRFPSNSVQFTLNSLAEIILLHAFHTILKWLACKTASDAPIKKLRQNCHSPYLLFFSYKIWTHRFSAGLPSHFKQVFWLRRHRSGSLPGFAIQWHPAETLPLQRRGPRRTHTCFPLSSSSGTVCQLQTLTKKRTWNVLFN